MLFVLNSAEDLFCRGFSRDEVKFITGVDIGYHGSKIKDLIKGVDRYEYYVEFVQSVTGLSVFRSLLDSFASGAIDSEGVFSGAGLGSVSYRLNLGKFCASLGLGDIWHDVKSSAYGARFVKIRKTMKVKYGHEYSYQCPELAAKARATMKCKYGAEYTRQVPELQKKCGDTTELHYGVRNSGSSSVVQMRRRKTMKSRYGFEYPMQVPSIKAKQRNTMTDLYGAPFSLQSPVLKPIIDATIFERYGVQYILQSDAIKQIVFDSNMRKYGVGWPMQTAEFRHKAMDTKRALGTFSSSSGEDVLYEKLVSAFGEDDVVRQYHSDVYPYDCDFYIRSRDMYVELNAFKGHGRHWFGSHEADSLIALDWQRRIKRPDDFYGVTYDVWTNRDVEKRNCARDNHLNYIVFWDTNVSDADLWFALGCPDGRDWEREYSWLPDRELCYDGDWPKELALTSGVIFKAVHMANWRQFYKPMLDIWKQRYDSKWGTIQARLYANRLKYLGKRPEELSNREIFRGLSISGIVHGYSGYYIDGFAKFVDIYRPAFIYDPCAGWGERMLACAVSGIQYLGVDINKKLIPGYLRLMKRYELSNVGVICGDSSRLDLSHGTHDCVFTCPPYESLEIYTEYGAENLSHEDFLVWWQSVINHAVCPDTKVFAYQIDQKHKDAMNQVLLDSGWSLDMQIPVGADKVNHMGRSKGVKSKKNFEEIQVFVR